MTEAFKVWLAGTPGSEAVSIEATLPVEAVEKYLDGHPGYIDAAHEDETYFVRRSDGTLTVVRIGEAVCSASEIEDDDEVAEVVEDYGVDMEVPS